MVDVKTTLALARKFIQYQDMWDYLCGYFDKNVDLTRMAKLTEAIMVDGSFGVDNHYQIPVLALGTHNHYKNQTLWLRLDLPELTQTTIESIPETTYVVRKRPGDLYLLLPSSQRFMRHLSAERSAIATANKQWLQDNPQLQQDIINYHKEYTYPKVPNADIDATLYQDGFLSDQEQALCSQFHAATMEQKVAMLEQLAHSKLQEQAIRILGRNYPDYLPKQYATEFANYLKQVNPAEGEPALVDYKNEPKLTPKAALEQITELKNSGKLNSAQLTLLDDLGKYIFTFY